MVFLAACDKENDDDNPAVMYDPPTWNEIVTTPNTGTPQERIDRFVEANQLDTVVTASGLIYVIERQGTGNFPTVDCTVTAW